MKVKVRFNTDDMLVFSLLMFGAIIAIFGLYYAGSKLIHWLSTSLSNLNLNF